MHDGNVFLDVAAAFILQFLARYIETKMGQRSRKEVWQVGQIVTAGQTIPITRVVASIFQH